MVSRDTKITALFAVLGGLTVLVGVRVIENKLLLVLAVIAVAVISPRLINGYLNSQI